MPIAMGGYVQSVRIRNGGEDILYVGGGHATSREGCHIVMKYDFKTGKWDKMPPYGTAFFAMTVINNELVLVGGYIHRNMKRGIPSDRLGMWSDKDKEWTYPNPYPDMPTARSECSAVVYYDWLVVAGGFNGAECLSCVEVMNINRRQWQTRPPTPVPWRRMKTALVQDICYFMGGSKDYAEANDVVYSLSLPALTSQISSNERPEKIIWNKISGLNVEYSSPVSMFIPSFLKRSLLAVGGMKNHKPVFDIHLYQPDTKEWVKFGDLPYPRYYCTCAVVNNRNRREPGDLLVAGGEIPYAKTDRIETGSLDC